MTARPFAEATVPGQIDWMLRAKSRSPSVISVLRDILPVRPGPLLQAAQGSTVQLIFRFWLGRWVPTRLKRTG